MRGSVQNEYVHVDYIQDVSFNSDRRYFKVVYEPLEEHGFLIDGVFGNIFFDGSLRQVNFRTNPGTWDEVQDILVDCDEVQSGSLNKRRGRIIMIWRSVAPPDHFLQVNYNYSGNEETGFFWLQEGF